eukprot:CAMPEP_0172848728 /NCGR_PEP_ID=MMETSP1075-20121228/44560_1 /TAXON_ID=2916 /ORGANISM="Ceratium fusus, Strain PA161109" /LENGTH=48 /DNA_ID= /DNA_START= /DNA_END= /DNA_ORIENTATION=
METANLWGASAGVSVVGASYSTGGLSSFGRGSAAPAVGLPAAAVPNST